MTGMSECPINDAIGDKRLERSASAGHFIRYNC